MVQALLIFLIFLIGFPVCSQKQSSTMKVIAGTGNAGFVDGKPAVLNKPIRFAPYAENSIIFADINNHAIRIATIDGEVNTIVGGPNKAGYKDGPADEAKLKSPHGVAYDKRNDKIYIAEASNHIIRVISKDTHGNYMVSTLAGVPEQAGFKDGDADSAKFISPHAVVIGNDGGIFVADIGNSRIRKVKDGLVSTIAGNLDELPGHETFKYIMDIVSVGDNIYIADAGNHSIYKVIPGQEVKTILLNDTLSTPHGIAVDKNNNLYIADMGTHRILKINEHGEVTTIAGTGEKGAKLNELNKPAAVLVHNNYLWIADLGNHQIKVLPLK